MRLTKTFLLFFLLSNIVCVTFAPKSISDEGQTSGSKDKKNNINVEKEEKEEDKEILDEGFKLDLQICEIEIFTGFKHKDAFDNFCEGLLNINEDNFDGIQSLPSTAHSYYEDLLDTLPQLNLPQLISPKIFCRTHYSEDAQKCIRLIQFAGCQADADGIACIQHLYFHWKLRDRNTTTRPIFGTSGVSDEILMEAFYKGYENPSDFDDEVLLQEYYDTHDHPRISEEDLRDNYQYYLAGHGNPNYNEYEREDPYDFETFRNIILRADREHFREYDLYHVRLAKYGVPTVSYNDLCQEHLRRDYLKHITEFYDNHYANFLIGEIKKYDCSQFKSRKEYCMEQIKMRRQELDF